MIELDTIKFVVTVKHRRTSLLSDIVSPSLETLINGVSDGLLSFRVLFFVVFRFLVVRAM